MTPAVVLRLTTENPRAVRAAGGVVNPNGLESTMQTVIETSSADEVAKRRHHERVLLLMRILLQIHELPPEHAPEWIRVFAGKERGGFEVIDEASRWLDAGFTDAFAVELALPRTGRP
jgi:hypothetical protein